MPTRLPSTVLTFSAAALALLAGCASPMQVRSADELRRSIAQSHQAELAQAQESPNVLTLTREERDLGFDDARMDELQRMAGPTSYAGTAVDAGEDLLGKPAERGTDLSLQDAIAGALKHNLQAQAARFVPSIGEAGVTQAEAAFDWVFFANVDWTSSNTPQLAVGGETELDRDTIGYETGIRKTLTSGGTFELSQSHTYTDDDSGVGIGPDPSNAVFVDVEFAQPILRGGGGDTNLAQVRLAQNAQAGDVLTLKQTLIDTITATESAYWDLSLAVHVLKVRERLLERGIETRDVLDARRSFDVRPSEYSDAVARVESRRGDVIRARNAVRLASDRLKALVNDPALPVSSEILVLPADSALDAPVSFSLADALSTALNERPDIQQAVLNIEDAGIRQQVASNARLPVLDLAVRARFNGLEEDAGDAYEEALEADFVDLVLGVQFLQELGNRSGDAQVRAANLGRMQSMVNYRAAVQNAAVDVKAALRDMVTNYRLIEQTRVARLAATENMRTLQVLEDTVQSLTPDFLDLKFSRQEALAAAELVELQALRDYNVAIANMLQVTGTSLTRNGIEFVVPSFDADGNVQ